MKQPHELVDTLARVGWIEQPVDLRNGRVQSTRQLSAAETRPLVAASGLYRKLVVQQFGEVGWVLVVLQRVVDVYRTFLPGGQDVCHGFVPEFPVDVRFADSVLGGGTWVELRVRHRVDLPRTDDQLELRLAVVHSDLADLHNAPSACSSAMSWRSRAVALPLLVNPSARGRPDLCLSRDQPSEPGMPVLRCAQCAAVPRDPDRRRR